jgi:hypothetical protein
MKNNNYLVVFLYFFFFLFLHFLIPCVQAADFRTSYNIEYYIRDNDSQGYTKTAYTIAITNLKPDLIIKKFTLSFPKSFGIGSMVAKDDKGGIQAVTVEKDRSIEVTFELNDPTPGLNEVNTLYLDFLQKNIFRAKGSIWEVFIPTLENKEGDSHSITVFLPPGQHKKLSLAKPIPSYVQFDKVTWNGDTGRSIYAVFGDEQRYSLNLSYHLTNPNLYKVYTDVAFPPDTVYQKIVIDSIIPPPNLVYTDADGNFMGRYNLDSKEEKLVQFKGIASVYATPRSEYRAYAEKEFESEQKNLFNAQPLWTLTTETPVKSGDMKDHYNFTIDTLSYNFSKIVKGNSRMGAAEALRFPDQAVCTEYSDLLIASARQRGIYVREMQGFAFANEQELRPVQTEGDVLHSWVEYFDTKKQVWISIDPTWEDTSGIDYFNSFDFNHIVFAIHGKKADYPYPAGSYKAAPGGQDIRIEPTTNIIAERKNVSASFSTLPLPSAQDSFSVDLIIKNTGNVNLWDIPISISADTALVDVRSMKIDHLFPGESKKIAVHFTPKNSLLYQSVRFGITYNGSEILQQNVQVPTFLSSAKKYAVPVAFVLGGLVVLGFVFKKRDH